MPSLFPVVSAAPSFASTLSRAAYSAPAASAPAPPAVASRNARTSPLATSSSAANRSSSRSPNSGIPAFFFSSSSFPAYALTVPGTVAPWTRARRPRQSPSPSPGGPPAARGDDRRRTHQRELDPLARLEERPELLLLPRERLRHHVLRLALGRQAPHGHLRRLLRPLRHLARAMVRAPSAPRASPRAGARGRTAVPLQVLPPGAGGGAGQGRGGLGGGGREWETSGK